MKQVHFNVLKEIESRFGVLDRVNEERCSFQIGWKVNLGEEKVSFNFTSDSVRIFNLEKCESKSKYKGLEELRQCIKKAGLEHLIYYAFDDTNSNGNKTLEVIGPSADGLEAIDVFYKTHTMDELDEMGGSLRRIGSRRR